MITQCQTPQLPICLLNLYFASNRKGSKISFLEPQPCHKGQNWTIMQNPACEYHSVVRGKKSQLERIEIKEFFKMKWKVVSLKQGMRPRRRNFSKCPGKSVSGIRLSGSDYLLIHMSRLLIHVKSTSWRSLLSEPNGLDNHHNLEVLQKKSSKEESKASWQGHAFVAKMTNYKK